MTPSYSTQANRDYWRYVYETSLAVAAWPWWKRGGDPDDVPDTAATRARLAELNELEARCVWLTK